MRVTTLPLRRELLIYEARDTELFREEFVDTSMQPIDMSAYAYRGAVKAQKGATETEICAVQFANDLPNGLICGWVDEDNYDALVAVVGAGGTVYVDIVETDPDGRDIQLLEIVGTLTPVSTGRTAP